MVLPTWLAASKFKKTFYDDLLAKHKTDQNMVDAVLASIRNLSFAYRHVFALSHANVPNTSTGPTEALHERVRVAKRSIHDCWEGIRSFSWAKVQNFHAAEHVIDLMDNYGVPRVCSCAKGERNTVSADRWWPTVITTTQSWR